MLPHPVEKVNGILPYPYKDRITKGSDPFEGKFGKKPQITKCLCKGKGNMTQIRGESYAYQLQPHKQL